MYTWSWLLSSHHVPAVTAAADIHTINTSAVVVDLGAPSGPEQDGGGGRGGLAADAGLHELAAGGEATMTCELLHSKHALHEHGQVVLPLGAAVAVGVAG